MPEAMGSDDSRCNCLRQTVVRSDGLLLESVGINAAVRLGRLELWEAAIQDLKKERARATE